jgi:hypothetical protein
MIRMGRSQTQTTPGFRAWIRILRGVVSGFAIGVLGEEALHGLSPRKAHLMEVGSAHTHRETALIELAAARWASSLAVFTDVILSSIVQAISHSFV